jgi:hypothetical protein
MTARIWGYAHQYVQCPHSMLVLLNPAENSRYWIRTTTIQDKKYIWQYFTFGCINVAATNIHWFTFVLVGTSLPFTAINRSRLWSHLKPVVLYLFMKLMLNLVVDDNRYQVGRIYLTPTLRSPTPCIHRSHHRLLLKSLTKDDLRWPE